MVNILQESNLFDRLAVNSTKFFSSEKFEYPQEFLSSISYLLPGRPVQILSMKDFSSLSSSSFLSFHRTISEINEKMIPWFGGMNVQVSP